MKITLKNKTNKKIHIGLVFTYYVEVFNSGASVAYQVSLISDAEHDGIIGFSFYLNFWISFLGDPKIKVK